MYMSSNLLFSYFASEMTNIDTTALHAREGACQSTTVPTLRGKPCSVLSQSNSVLGPGVLTCVQSYTNMYTYAMLNKCPLVYSLWFYKEQPLGSVEDCHGLGFKCSPKAHKLKVWLLPSVVLGGSGTFQRWGPGEEVESLEVYPWKGY